jgi:hypothetical protein
MKIYLNLPNCVFVLAIDGRQLERAIAQYLPGASEEENDSKSSNSIHQAREYLEKICQDVWQLPLVPITSQDALLRSCFDAPAKGEDADFDNLLSTLTSFGCLPANARKLKSYANTLRRFREHCLVKKDTGEPRHAQLLAIMSCLYHFHPQIYRVLELNPGFYNEMLLWAEGKKTGHAVFDGIKVVSETVADHTVRIPDPATGDYFRIARLVRDVKDVTETEVKNHLLPYART